MTSTCAAAILGGMALMDIAVGSIVGAMVGWPGLYMQSRMKRKEEIRTLAMDSAHASWEQAHSTGLILTTQIRRRSSPLGDDFYEQVNVLGNQLDATSMIIRNRHRPAHLPVYQASQILLYMAPGGEVSDAEKLKIACAVIEHVQWVLSAFLLGRPAEHELEQLAEYERLICTF